MAIEEIKNIQAKPVEIPMQRQVRIRKREVLIMGIRGNPSSPDSFSYSHKRSAGNESTKLNENCYIDSQLKKGLTEMFEIKSIDINNEYLQLVTNQLELSELILDVEYTEKNEQNDKQIIDVCERITLWKDAFDRVPKPKAKLIKVATVLDIVFLIIAIVCIALSLTVTLGGGDIDLFGYQFKRVLTESMDGAEQPYAISTVPTDSLVVIDLIDEKNSQEFYAALKVGDVITFINMLVANTSSLTITHRIIDIENIEKNGQILYNITTRGDNNPEETVENIVSTDNLVVGKVVVQSVVLGEIHKVLTSKNGILYTVLIPIGLLMLLAIFRFFTVISNEKVECLSKAALVEIDTLLNDIEEKMNS